MCKPLYTSTGVDLPTRGRNGSLILMSTPQIKLQTSQQSAEPHTVAHIFLILSTILGVVSLLHCCQLYVRKKIYFFLVDIVTTEIEYFFLYLQLFAFFSSVKD